MSPLRALFKDFLVYGSGDLLLRASALLTLPLYTRLFPPSEFGIWAFVATAAALIGTMVSLGGESAYARLFFDGQDPQRRRLVTSTWLIALGAWSLLVAAITVPFAAMLSKATLGTTAHASLYAVALLSLPVTLLHGACGQVLRNAFRPGLYSLLNILTVGLGIAGSLVAVLVLHLGVLGILLGPLAAGVVLLPVRLWSVRHHLSMGFSWDVLRRLLAFGLPLVPMAIAYWVLAASDRLLVGRYAGLDALGLYSVAVSVTAVLGLLHTALGQAWSPHAFRAYDEDPVAASRFYGRVLTYLLLGFGGLTVLGTTFAHEGLRLVASSQYAAAALAVGPLALGALAYTSTQVTAIGMSLSKRTRPLAYGSVLAAVLNMTLNVLLIPRWGFVAAAWTTAATYIALTIAYAFISQRLAPVAYETRRIVPLSILTLGAVVAAPFLPAAPLGQALVIKTAYVLAYLLALVALRVVDGREWTGLWRNEALPVPREGEEPFTRPEHAP